MGLHGYFVGVAAFLILHTGNVAGQFTAAPPTCPGGTMVFTCTVTGDMRGVTLWRVNGSSECLLSHNTAGATATCGSGSAFTATPVTGFGTSATSFSSTLSGTATSALNGTLVECFGPNLNRTARNRVGDSTLQMLGPPTAPTLSCVDLSEGVSGAVNVTVSWALSDGDSADFYLINITTNAPQTPYGGLLNITTGSVTQYELTGFTTGYEYNITVHGICGSQMGSESEHLTITPQVPTTPTFDVCAVYDTLNGALQFIESTWMEVEPVTVSQNCLNGRNIRASYELSYTTDCGTLITTCVVDGTECSDGTCRHVLQNNTADSRCQPPVSQFNGEGVTASVTARNVVGRSNPAVSRSISGTNILGVHVDTTNPNNVFVDCTISQPGYTCTIDYGTDPSYTNLVYRDTSFTQGRMATITLSQRLRGDTTYYYTVSAESNSQCVRVRGRFQTGCLSTDLTPTDAVRQCTDRGFVNTLPIPSGVVCYSRTTAGSEAVYICDDGFQQNGAATRVCQSNGVWNGSTPQCLPSLGRQDGAVGSLSTGVAAGIATVTGTLGILVGFLAGLIVFYCISKHQFKSSSFKPKPSSHQPEQQEVTSSNSLQQTSPEYEEVLEMRKNTSYGELTKLERRVIISQHEPQSSEPESFIEMKKNSSYGDIKKLEMRAIISQQSSEPESSHQQQQQTSAEYEEPVPNTSEDGTIDLGANAAHQC